MYTFRFNPVFHQWVLLGGPVTMEERIEGAHFTDIGKSRDFGAIIHPRQPFLLEPPAAKPFHQEKGLAFASKPPVGEYEILLYKGYKEFFAWDETTWETWFKLVQIRIRQFQHNPHLHHVHLVLHTSALESVEPYQRVGDLIATSHPVVGMMGELSVELAEKLHEKESVFHLLDDKYGRLYVPSAPLQEREIWYLPAQYQPGVDHVQETGRKHFARVMETLLKHLHAEYPYDHYVLVLHTALAGSEKDTTWWLQMYRDEGGVPSPLPTHGLPELFMRELRFSLKNR